LDRPEPRLRQAMIVPILKKLGAVDRTAALYELRSTSSRTQFPASRIPHPASRTQRMLAKNLAFIKLHS